jgi:hypothetical protein
VDLLFIDSSHQYEDTLEEFRVWEPVIRPGGFVVFHDYGRRWEGVTRAVDELQLGGVTAGTSLYVWCKPKRMAARQPSLLSKLMLLVAVPNLVSGLMVLDSALA